MSSRIAEYLFADFQAQTDFKVGVAIRYLKNTKGVRVEIGQKHSSELFQDEGDIIRELRSKSVRLLNQHSGYDYRSADRDSEKERVHRFCDDLLADAQHLSNSTLTISDRGW